MNFMHQIRSTHDYLLHLTLLPRPFSLPPLSFHNSFELKLTIMFLFLFLLLAFLLLLSLLSSSNYNNYGGPPSYPVIGCLLSFYKNRRRLLDWYTELLSVSPTQTIVVNRLGARRTVITANQENVEYVLKTNFDNYPKGKPFSDVLGDLLGFGIFNVDGALWSAQRKLASHEFSAKSLREFVVDALEEEVNSRLIPLLESAASNQTPIDLQDALRRFAFDTVSKVSLGNDPRCLDLDLPAPPLAAAFDVASLISAARSVAPVSAVWKAKRLLGIGSEKELRKAVELVRGSVMDIIRNKREKLDNTRRQNLDDSGSGDLLARLLSAGHGDDVARDMVISFIMAGRDTTSSAMTWLFWLLSTDAAVERRLVDEVMAISGDERPLESEDLKRMNYAKACLCESMRLYPPVAWDSKHAGNDDVLPDGTPVRKGDRVTYFPYGMGRMEELWGEDRFEFKPDRWLDEPGREGEPVALRAVNPYKFPVFQAGPRVCLGKEMAFVQMKYVVASILRRFEIKPVGSGKPVFVPLLTAHMANGFKVTVHKRKDRGGGGTSDTV